MPRQAKFVAVQDPSVSSSKYGGWKIWNRQRGGWMQGGKTYSRKADAQKEAARLNRQHKAHGT